MRIATDIQSTCKQVHSLCTSDSTIHVIQAIALTILVFAVLGLSATMAMKQHSIACLAYTSLTLFGFAFLMNITRNSCA